MNLDNSYDTPPQLCPKCGYLHDAATSLLEGGAPSPGDVTVCMKCAAILEFGPDLKVRELAPGEWVMLPREIREVVCKVVSAIRVLDFVHKLDKPYKIT